MPTDGTPDEPPEVITLDLHEALSLLAALEDACDALIDARRFVVVLTVEAEIARLNRKLGFDDPSGGPDD